MKYSIDTDTGVEFRDSGRWRSYDLITHGDTLEELIDEAYIAEVDQDGGEIDCYALPAASAEIQRAAFALIEKCIQGAPK